MARPRNDGRGRIGGRSKGTPNKKTSSHKEFISNIIELNREKFQEHLDDLDAKDWVNTMIKLYEYVLPKQSASTSKIEIDRLTEEQINQVIEQISFTDNEN